MKFQPAKNIVVLTPVKPDELKTMGIVNKMTLETATTGKQPELGLVVSLGEAKHDSELPIDSIKIGDVVTYRQYGDNKFMLGNDEFIFVVFDDILSILAK